MLRSFLLRLSLILSTTLAICLFLMGVTLVFQEARAGANFCFSLLGVVMIWLIVNFIVQKKLDPELSVEVARILYPAGGVLSIGLSMLLSLQLESMIPGNEGAQHFILIFVGIGISLFFVVRGFDIKWLRLEAEIRSIEERQD
jgi:hypothetical protein